MLPLRLKNGSTILMETATLVADENPGAPLVSDEDLHPEGVAMYTGTSAPLPTQEFSEAVKVVEGLAEELGERLGQPTQGKRKRMLPQELELGVRVGFDAKGNVFIASGSASASLELKLKWKIASPAASEPAVSD